MKPSSKEQQLAYDSNRSLEQNARLKSELAEAVGFLEAIMEHIPEAITVTDARDLSIRMVSKFGRELLGPSNEKIEGLTYQQYTGLQDILHADGITLASWEELPLTRATLKGEIITNEEWALRRSDGKKLNLLCNSGPILDQQGNVIAGITIWRDITKRKRIEEELRDKNITARKDMEEEL